MIEGAILTILAIGGSIIAVLLAYFTRKLEWSDRWYVRVGISLLGCIAAFVLLFLYVQLKELPGVQKGATSPVGM